MISWDDETPATRSESGARKDAYYVSMTHWTSIAVIPPGRKATWRQRLRWWFEDRVVDVREWFEDV